MSRRFSPEMTGCELLLLLFSHLPPHTAKQERPISFMLQSNSQYLEPAFPQSWDKSSVTIFCPNMKHILHVLLSELLSSNGCNSDDQVVSVRWDLLYAQQQRGDERKQTEKRWRVISLFHLRESWKPISEDTKWTEEVLSPSFVWAQVNQKQTWLHVQVQVQV